MPPIIQLPDFHLPSVISVTGQEIDISALTKMQQEFYVSLFIDLINKYQKGNKSRMIMGLAGPTGSGKSVIAAIFEELAKQIDIYFKIQTLGIDAFHYPNNFLESHIALDGKILKQVKGRFDTYDVAALVATLNKFKSGNEIHLPEYSRQLHNPLPDVHSITQSDVLLLVEGLWLYYPHFGWDQILPLVGHKIFIEAEKHLVKEMVLQRHEKGGRTRQSAIEHYENVDAVNFDMVMTTKYLADKIIPSYYAVG